MTRIAFWASVIAVALSGGAAVAQPPPWAGGPPRIGELYGYSPFIPSVDPFPTKTSPYYHSMFHPVYGGKRVSPFLVTNPRRPTVIRQAPVVAAPEVPVVMIPPDGTAVSVGPVVQTEPVRGLHRFRR